MAGKFDKMGKIVFTLDCKGFASPLPQKYTIKKLKSMSIGDIQEVILDNPSSLNNGNIQWFRQPYNR